MGKHQSMSNPASAPRRVFLMLLVLLTLASLVVLMYSGHLIAAVVVGVLGAGILVAAARPQGAPS